MPGPIYRRGRRDEAEEGVVRAFEAGGATVEKLDRPVDLLVGFLSETHLVEVKTNKARLRGSQETFAKRWTGSPPVIARTGPQARKWLKVWRERAEKTRIVFPKESSLGTLIGLSPEETANICICGGGIDAALEDSEDLGAEKTRSEPL